MLSKLFRRSVIVKPAVANSDGSLWLVLYQNPLQAFVDDLLRYNVHVAVYNLLWVLKHD